MITVAEFNDLVDFLKYKPFFSFKVAVTWESHSPTVQASSAMTRPNPCACANALTAQSGTATVQKCHLGRSAMKKQKVYSTVNSM